MSTCSALSPSAPLILSSLLGLALLGTACNPEQDAPEGDSTGSGFGDDGGDEGSEDDSGGGGEEDYCAGLGLSERAWQEAEDDSSLKALAADITLPTTAGDVVLSELWTGCDTYLFLNSEPNQADGYDWAVWERDHRDFLERLPANTHVFFMASSTKSDERDESMALIEEEMGQALEREYDDEEERAAVAARIHYVTVRDRSLDGWIGTIMKNPGWGAAIDRFQRIRYVGSYADYSRYDDGIGWFEPNLSMAANEAIYYNFEAERQDALDADGATVVTVFDGDQGSAKVTVSLPDEGVVEAADTLVLDLTMDCIGDGEYGDCPAWDYMAYLYMCDEAASEDNPYSDTACESGDTLEGACTTPLGDESTGTYACKDDGSGYEDLSCSCSTEIGRWITTYHREGRWAYDISPMLPLFDGAEERTLYFQSSNSYELYGELRFVDGGKTHRPRHLQYLSFSESEETFEVPSTAAKVELATVISQHGQNSYNGGNCGEFCDATHSFTFNGDISTTYSRTFEDAGTAEGCMDQVAEGTVPNQYGTWWYGRAGWCPGKEVPTVTVDITSLVTVGGENTVLYEIDDTQAAGTVRRRYWILSSE